MGKKKEPLCPPCLCGEAIFPIIRHCNYELEHLANSLDLFESKDIKTEVKFDYGKISNVEQGILNDEGK